MKKYEVKLSEGALSRLDALYDHIAYKLEASETAQV